MRGWVVLAVVAAACGHDFDYGGSHFPCDAVERCPGGYDCVFGRCSPSCVMAGSSCPVDEPICDLASGGCRQCQVDTDCEGLDHCTARGDCVECARHDHCESKICDGETNSCVATADVVPVTPETIGPVVQDTLPGATGTVWVLLAPGTYAATSIDAPVRARFVASPPVVSPTVTRVILDGVRVTGGADVTIEGATIRSNAGDKAAVECVAASVVLRAITVTPGPRLDPAAAGVHATDCELAIRGSTLDGNANGLSALGGRIEIVSTVIANSTASGGVWLQHADGVFGFNTVIDNHHSTEGRAAGVTCNGGTVTAPGNLVYSNGPVNVAGSCGWSHSNIEGGADGIGMVDAPPVFDPSRLFHLLPGAPGVDATDLGVPGMLLDDLDGEPRPRNGSYDIGADEL